MPQTLGWLPPIDAALIAVLLVALVVALATRRRGGRFRGLIGWVGFWVFFSAMLVCLSRAPVRASLTLLGLLMFVGLRTYFFVVPMRPKDRWAILAAYLVVPLDVYLAFRGSTEEFLVVVPVVLFLGLPSILALGSDQDGLLDSLGRLLLGGGLFLFCAPHLGLMARWPRPEALELFGVLVIAAELPQRLAGRAGPGTEVFQRASGVAASAILALAAGFWLGPWCGVTAAHGAGSGLLVAAAVTLGAWVGAGAVQDVTPGSPITRLVGRGAFLDRVIPAVYAAPVYFHYLA